MTKFFWLLVGAMFFITGCGKEEKGCTNVKPADEAAQIAAFATANGITTTKHSSGMYYQIINPGTSPRPAINDSVTVNYTGRYLDYAIFDKSIAPVTFKLVDVIEGWITGVPLISKGGKIKLLIPSTMAYGCNGARTIPSNAVLYFDIDLLDVK